MIQSIGSEKSKLNEMVRYIDLKAERVERTLNSSLSNLNEACKIIQEEPPSVYESCNDQYSHFLSNDQVIQTQTDQREQTTEIREFEIGVRTHGCAESDDPMEWPGDVIDSETPSEDISSRFSSSKQQNEPKTVNSGRNRETRLRKDKRYENSHENETSKDSLENHKKFAKKDTQDKEDREQHNLSKHLGVLSLEELTSLNKKIHRSRKKRLHPIVKKCLRSDTFTKYPVQESGPVRRELPVENPEPKVDIVALVRKAIGKDIMNLCLPASINQPIGGMMRFEELFSYKEAFDRAAKENDSLLRLGLSVIPIFLDYGFVGKMRQKPFNPFIGQTHEMLWEDMEIIGENLQNSPPLVAVHASTSSYSFESKKTDNFRFF